MTMTRSRTTDKRFFGVVEGLVVANDDPEHPGCVKVTYPWFDEHMVTDWCRVAQPYAGPDHGAFFIPELESEVVIGFVHGDIRRPIVLGGLYNGQDAPPTAKSPSRDEKMIRTRAGHVVILDDTSGSEKIVIKDKDERNSVVFDTVADSITVEASTGELVLKGKSVLVDAQTTLELKAGASAKVGAPTIDLN